jgi:hypothetical protein
MRVQAVLTAGRRLAQLIRSSTSFRSAFFAFGLTRAIVLGCLVLATNAHYEGVGAPPVEATIYVRQHGMLHWLAEAITAADANGTWGSPATGTTNNSSRLGSSIIGLSFRSIL